MELGLYESLMTRVLMDQLSGVRESFQPAVDPADQPHVLARHLADIAHGVLRGVAEDRRIAIMQELMQVLDRVDQDIVPPARQLRSVLREPQPGAAAYESARPSTPLADAALLTNTHGEPNLATEVKAEIGSSDDVRPAVRLVKWHGLRVLDVPLRRLCERGAPFRVITTTYVGATERLAWTGSFVNSGAQVKVQYDIIRTRLHAKAWMFRRNTQFDTAYVGSSNLWGFCAP